MSKHNYSNYSKPKTKPVDHESETVIEDQTVAPEVTAVPEPEVSETRLIGLVGNCARLNVREEPSTMANVVVVLEAGSEVQLTSEESIAGFYKVTTADGREGYCMCDYISIL